MNEPSAGTRVDVRRARRGDLDALTRLAGELGKARRRDDVGARLESLSALSDHVVFVAETPAGEVVGWVHAFVAHRLQIARFAEIGGLVVAREERGRGVGRSLISAVESWAVDQAVRKVRVRSNLVRESAHRFYRKLGYAELKSQSVLERRPEP